MEGKYTKILNEVFGVLGLSEQEKEMASESLKKKFFAELLVSLEERLPQSDRDWIAANINTQVIDQNAVAEIRQKIKHLYSREEITSKSHEVFNNLLARYVKFMTSRVGPDKSKKLEEVVSSIIFV
ncbi:MAG: hypothetical protein HYT62_04435 [Candidatus Yanofskybacteria bacterium]|nr:hypothetical protein [Candidatus Yanofskybacteria bacterium]